MSFESLDLNLIRVLKALVTHRSATAAAAALSMTQPQVSRVLARLRKQTGDVLLTRAGNGMEPTATAIALAGAFDAAFDTAASLLDKARVFDAASSSVKLRVSMNDYEAALILPGLFQRLQASAPGVRVAVVSQRPSDVPEALLAGRVQLAIGRFTKPSGDLRYKPLFEEKLVAAVRHGHPLVHKPTLKSFVAHPHVLVSPGGRGDFHGLLDERLQAKGLKREVRMSVSQFMVAPLVAAQSDAVVLLPQRLMPWVACWGLRPIALPIELPGFQVSMLWRERNHQDAAHKWLRKLVQQSLADSEKQATDHPRLL
jgi:DNA-binding transcriptional LysR family regulator